MTEEEIKKLVQNSVLNTSDSFVDGLMDKIEAKKRAEAPSVWPLKTLLLAICGILLLMSYSLYKLLHISTEKLIIGGVSNTVIFFLFSLICFSIISYILRLHKEYSYSQSEVSISPS